MGLGFGLRGSDLGLGLDKNVLKVTPSIYFYAENLGGWGVVVAYVIIESPQSQLGLDLDLGLLWVWV